MKTYLEDVRVVELADEQGEYCGLVLAGLGADVVKVEPPEGSSTRRIGPFFEDRSEDIEKSLFFWNHNRGKRSIAIDLTTEGGKDCLLDLLSRADVFLESTAQGYLQSLGLGQEMLRARFPHLVIARISPFGDKGPWVDYKGSDLVHLALGGPMMNCGYDPKPNGEYDTPPIAGQVWNAYYITGEQCAMAIVAAMVHQRGTGQGQYVSCAVHDAVSKNTELDLMNWIMRRAPFYRQTCRHANEQTSLVPSITHTKDGRWIHTIPLPGKGLPVVKSFLAPYGVLREDEAAESEAEAQQTGRAIPGSSPNSGEVEISEMMGRLWRKFLFANAPWREAQAAGLLTAPLRKPHENVEDEHWRTRGTFCEIDHPELGRSFTYVTSKWLSTTNEWKAGRRAPLLDEDRGAIRSASFWPDRASSPARAKLPAAAVSTSPLGKPFPLQNIRICDFTWFLASAGGTRFMSAYGAQCIKIEWKDHPDTRLGAGAPEGGRVAREQATVPLPGSMDPDMGGQFLNKNPGKLGISLNVRHPEGLEIARRLIGMSDVVAEGFSPGVMDRWGLGYDKLREIKQDIIYVQQSGMGTAGVYGRFRAVGTVAAALAGTSEMSGLPEPAMPAGWGYSYLDWIGAYSMGLAIMSAVYQRNQTGVGQHIDASQVETGIFLTGVPVLDWSANGREWKRFGNRSPYKPAAPHGAYRCAGNDRWLAIACFDDDEWLALTRVAQRREWAGDPRFSSLAARLNNQDALDRLVDEWTRGQDGYELMHRLQAAGVAAGVCQTAGDRCDRDPQLKALDWLTEVTGTKIGTWPIAEISAKLDETPAHVGGLTNRGAPCYGEDNEYVYGDLLGYSSAQIGRLAKEGVI